MHLHSRQQSKVCLQTYFLDGGEGWRRHRNTTPGNFHSLGSCLLPGIKKRKTKQQQHKKQRKFYTRKCDFNLLKKIILIKQSKAKCHPWGGGGGGVWIFFGTTQWSPWSSAKTSSTHACSYYLLQLTFSHLLLVNVPLVPLSLASAQVIKERKKHDS